MLEPHVSTKGDKGRIVPTVLGMVAEMERGFIKVPPTQRHREGQGGGGYKGGKTHIDAGKALSLRQVGKGASEIARERGTAGCRSTASCRLAAL